MDFETLIIRHIKRNRPKIYTVIRHVSSSGMFRLISCYLVYKGDIVNIDWLVEKMTSYKCDSTREGLRVSGCGMDMGFSVVYNFSNCLFPKGFKYRKGENHRNGDPSPTDPDGGYALKQAWI